MTEDKNKELSRRKYVCRMEACNGTINVHRHPIIYSNKKYVYYKVHGADELGKIETRRVHDSPSDCPEAILELTRYSYTPRAYFFWDVQDDYDPNDELLMKEAKVMILKNRQERCLKAYEDAQRVANAKKKDFDIACSNYNMATFELEQMQKGNADEH